LSPATGEALPENRFLVLLNDDGMSLVLLRSLNILWIDFDGVCSISGRNVRQIDREKGQSVKKRAKK
jgi:hypothetical protein